ncbi:hypothetical protein RUM44_002233 [Polyplax serrata]|uniref:BOD1/SHG1 domain-containing protein n=1 Tax=Polyplax serrata TaxID=468196 RepID=A0ABR1AMB7_POLSC
MDVGVHSYPHGDSILIDKIVNEFLSQGKFDKLRKECMSDADTKPAYQNLQQRVESTVTQFLKKQVWRPDLNKNQLRDTLRKHILDSNFFDAGINRIVDQVVNPNVLATLFLPEVEEVVYSYLSIPRPLDKSQKKASSLNDFDKFKGDSENDIKGYDTNITCAQDRLDLEQSTNRTYGSNKFNELYSGTISDDMKIEDGGGGRTPKIQAEHEIKTEPEDVKGEEVASTEVLGSVSKTELPSDDSQESLSRIGVEKLQITESERPHSVDSDDSTPLEINEKSMSESKDSEDSIMNQMSPISQGRLTPDLLDEPKPEMKEEKVEVDKRPLTFIGRIPKLKREDSDSSKSWKKEESAKCDKIDGKNIYSSDESDSSKSCGKSDSDDKKSKEKKEGDKKSIRDDKSRRDDSEKRRRDEDRHKNSKSRDKEKDRDRDKERERERDRDKDRGRERDRDREKERDRDRDRDRDRERDKERSRDDRYKESSSKDRKRDRSRDRISGVKKSSSSSSSSRDKSMSRHKSSHQSKDRHRDAKSKEGSHEKKRKDEEKKKNKSTDDHSKERNRKDDRRSTDRDSNERDRSSGSRSQGENHKRERENKVEENQSQKTQKEEEEAEADVGLMQRSEEVVIEMDDDWVPEGEEIVLVNEEWMCAGNVQELDVGPLEAAQVFTRKKKPSEIRSEKNLEKALNISELLQAGALTRVNFPKLTDDFYVKFNSTGFKYFEEWEQCKLDCEEEFKEFVDEAENNLDLISDDDNEDHAKCGFDFEEENVRTISNLMAGLGNFRHGLTFDPSTSEFYSWTNNKFYQRYRKKNERRWWSKTDRTESEESIKENINRVKRSCGDFDSQKEKNKENVAREAKKALHLKLLSRYKRRAIRQGKQRRKNRRKALYEGIKEVNENPNTFGKAQSENGRVFAVSDTQATFLGSNLSGQMGRGESRRDRLVNKLHRNLVESGATPPETPDVGADGHCQRVCENMLEVNPVGLVAVLPDSPEDIKNLDGQKKEKDAMLASSTHRSSQNLAEGEGEHSVKVPSFHQKCQLPLSPESDDCNPNGITFKEGSKSKRMLKLEPNEGPVPKKQQRRSYSQKYDSQDLYKPRPVLNSSRTRARGDKKIENENLDLTAVANTTNAVTK